MAASNDGYWSRSYGLLTRDQGWIKPLLVLAAARMVPIVGPFGADGYALEWARLTSWDVDSAPKQKNVDIGACIGSGARAFVVALGYGLIIAIVSLVFRTIFGAALGGIFNILLGAFCGVFITIAKLRATIYQSIGAGYQLNRIWDMVKRDSNGVLHIIGLSLLLGVIVSMIAAVLFGTVLIANFAGFISAAIEYEAYNYIDEYYLASTFLSFMAKSLPALMVLSYLVLIAHTFTQLIITTSVGLWLRQFDVRNWGQSADPLPGNEPTYPADTTGYQQSGNAAAGGYEAPVANAYAHEEPAAPASEQQSSYGYQSIPMPVPTTNSANVVASASEPAMQTTDESAAVTRTFSLEDAADGEPEFLQPVVEAKPVEAEPETSVLETVTESVTEDEPVAEPKAEPMPSDEHELTTDEMLEQVEAAIHEADMTLVEEEEPETSATTRTFSLDEVALDMADDETVAEAEPVDVYEDDEPEIDDDRPLSDDVITKVIPLGGTSTEQEE